MSITRLRFQIQHDRLVVGWDESCCKMSVLRDQGDASLISTRRKRINLSVKT